MLILFLTLTCPSDFLFINAESLSRPHHSGIEIVSFDERKQDDIILTPKATMNTNPKYNNFNGFGPKKTTYVNDEEDSIFIVSQNQNRKHLYKSDRTIPELKALQEPRPNIIEGEGKIQTNPTRQTNEYVRMKITFPKNLATKDTGAKLVLHDQNSNLDQRHEKPSALTILNKVNVKRSNFNSLNQVSRSRSIESERGNTKEKGILDTDLEFDDLPSEDSNLDKIIDADRIVDENHDANNNPKVSNSYSPASKPVINSLQNRKGLFINSPKNSIYPFNSDTLRNRYRQKSIHPLRSKTQPVDSNEIKVQLESETYMATNVADTLVNDVSTSSSPHLNYLKNRTNYRGFSVAKNVNHLHSSNNKPVNIIPPYLPSEVSPNPVLSLINPLPLPVSLPPLFRPVRTFDLPNSIMANHDESDLSILQSQGRLRETLEPTRLHLLDDDDDSNYKFSRPTNADYPRMKNVQKYLNNVPYRRLSPSNEETDTKDNPTAIDKGSTEIAHADKPSENLEEIPEEREFTKKGSRQTTKSLKSKESCDKSNRGDSLFYKFLGRVSNHVLDTALSYEESVQSALGNTYNAEKGKQS